MEHITAFKIITENEFIPTKNYEITNERKYQKIKCIKKAEGGWYFSTEIPEKDLLELFEQPFTRMKSETGTFRIHDMEKKLLTYIGSRDS